MGNEQLTDHNMVKIKLLIVDDDPEWLEDTCKFLSQFPDFHIVATASNHHQALSFAQIFDIDLVLTNISLQGQPYGGLLAVSEISRLKRIKVITHANQSEEAMILQSYAAGAFYFIAKNNYSDAPEIIRFCFRYGRPFDFILNEYQRLLKVEQLMPLTPAEREIYQLLEQGWTQLQIRERLFKSESTLKNQIRLLLKKLGAHSTKEAIRIVNTHGIIKLMQSRN